MAAQSLLQVAAFLENHLIEFVQEVPDRLKCIICMKILRNAKQTSCGCKACEHCISAYLKDEEKLCPSKQPDCVNSKLRKRDIQQDNATNKEIANLKIKCPFKSCYEEDIIRNMLSHVDVCKHREVTCEKCNKKYIFESRISHEQNECEQRSVVCTHCYVAMTDFVLNTVHLNKDRENLCSKYVGDCPNDCTAKNVLLREHLQQCSNKRMECPFHELQCSKGKLNQRNMLAHLQNESISHSNSLVREIVSLKDSNKSLMEDVKRMKTLLEEQMRIIEKLTDSRIKTERSIDELKRRGPGSALSPEKNVVFRNASFIWKLADFETLKTDAESGGRASVTSDPFYTSEFGYKMCLRIYPFGDGVGRGNHLSVFFALMKGEFDDILSWPFKQKVTLSLIDQENNGNKNHSDTFKPDARSACYQKPVDECNIASGSPKFISLSSLYPSSVYYKNDTIFLKISVDTMGISKP